MTAALNYVLGHFEVSINTGDSQGLTIYLQDTREIEKEAESLDIPDSKYKDIIDLFLSLSNKYSW